MAGHFSWNRTSGSRAAVALTAVAAVTAATLPVSAGAQSSPAVRYIALPPRATIAPVMNCADLAKQSFARLPEAPTRILSADVQPGSSGRGEECVVKGYVAPAIRFELRLPTSGYTGRYLQGGCGGMCGQVFPFFAPGCTNEVAFSGAFATGFSDSGHVGKDGSDGVWAMVGEQARIDYGHRSPHALAIAAKAIIATFYGRKPDYSYFSGCSGGGREAMVLTQRYPNDFDGVIAGAGPHAIAQKMHRYLWQARWGLDEQGRSPFTAESVKLLHNAVMAQCDARDGLADGQIDDPRACSYDPGLLRCKAGETTGCLSDLQVDTARKFYQGPVDAQGRRLYMGGEPYGSELGWFDGLSLARLGTSFIDNFVHGMLFQGKLPPSVTARNWTFDVPTLRDLAKSGALLEALDADLRPFRDAGGKLILWQGAADSAAGAYAYLDYYQQVRDKVGGLTAARTFARTFVVPGVYHCGGGYIAYQGDFLGAMVRWVELKQAPDQIVFSGKLADGTVRERPVYAYPVRARYVGRGSINDYRNFTGVAPRKEPNDRYEWAGANLFD